MRLTKKDIPELITKFAEAVRADEMRGAQPPEEHTEIINNYRETRSDLAVWFHHTLDRVEKLEAERAIQVTQNKWRDAERRLAEANALLEQVYQYVDSKQLGKLGQSRVKALIDSHEWVTAQLKSVSKMVEDFDCDNDDRRVEAGWEALRKWGKEYKS